MRKRFPGVIVLLTAGLLSRAPARGAEPVAILFVGNSFCHGKYAPVRNYNSPPVVDENEGLPPGDPRSVHSAAEFGPYGGIPGIFKKMTDEAGLDYDVHVELVSATALAFHYEYALPVIAQAKWNAVVLQDYSTGPLPVSRGGKPESFLRYASLLEGAVHAANPRAKVYLYETWPRADLVYPAKRAYSGQSVEMMAADLHDAYQREFAADAHFAAVAWVGDAWLQAMHAGVALANPYAPEEKGPRLDLWAIDHYHPSVPGAYLSALILFKTITGVEPQTLGPDERAASDLGLPGADAAKLQAIAASPPGSRPSSSGDAPAAPQGTR